MTATLPVIQQGEQDHPRHPLGTRAKVLLTSVFGPFDQDDEFGSRTINPPELYQNQVTREQGVFSLRMFHGSWGLQFIQANIDAPCTLLDFPTQDRFIHELRTNAYDIIGISSIMVNALKVREMCRLIREIQPNAKIVVGGHFANVEDVETRMDADYIVKGEGVEWFCRYLGQDKPWPYRHPLITSGFGARSLGISSKEKKGDVAAVLITGVGCPLGCDFCSTSAKFGGKGRCIDFYKSGEELFDVMCQIEEAMHVQSFFVMDENFLLNKKRALRLLELMEQRGKAWSLYIFSSANALRKYTMEQLVRLGVSWVWMGLEGEESAYTKLKGVNTQQLVSELHAHGIRVLGSAIIGLDHHTPENIDEAIDWAVGHECDFLQIMLYTPLCGTPLFQRLSKEGRLLSEDELEFADRHGQYRFSHKHPNIPAGQETEMLTRAFKRDFLVNGPSLVRIVRTTLLGWRRYRNHPDERIRRRYAFEVKQLATQFSAIVGASELYYRGKDAAMHRKILMILRELRWNFGLKSWFFSMIGGHYVHWAMKREERRLANGWTYEPPTSIERNFGTGNRCRYVVPRTQ